MAISNILGIVLTNIQKHKHWAAKINGDTFMLCGPNEAGKSAVLRAIDHMIGKEVKIANGKAVVSRPDLPDDVLTRGEEEGEIELLIGHSGDEYRVRRKISKKGLGRYELHKTAANGRFDAITPAAERFQEIFGNVIDFSPLIFMSGAEQFLFLQEVIGEDSGIKASIESIRSAVKTLREERLAVGRSKTDADAKFLDPDFRALVNYVGEEPTPLEPITAKKIDTTQVATQISSATIINAAADGHIETLQGIAAKVKDEGIKIALHNAIELFEAKKVDTEVLQKQIDTAAETNAKLDLELKEAKERNEKIAKSVEYIQVKASIGEYKKQYDDYTADIKNRLGLINEQLSKFGLNDVYEGLSLEYEMDEEGNVGKQGLFLRGLPFKKKQQSDGEMIKVLVLLSKAFNPNGFSYVKIQDWNLLDEANQDMVLKIAADNDIQLGIEKVDNGKEVVLQLIEK